jgi:hypothetical protein
MSSLVRPRAIGRVLPLALLCAWLAGCGGSESAVDSGPFEAAIVRYLDQNNMRMAVKEIKEGPTLDGDSATLVASLTRADVGGPSVTWTFRFEKDGDGTWKAVGHED